METLHVTRWGQAGPKVIMVHGSAQGSRTGGDRHFARQQILGERGWEVLVPDRPGHGLSADPGRPDDAAADGALIAELIGDGAHLVGHSFGGCVALAATVLRPDKVHSLTLIEPAMPLLAMNKLVVLRFGIKVAMVSLLPMSNASRLERFVKLVNVPPELRGTDGADPAELDRMGLALKRLRLPSKKTLQEQLHLVRDARIPLLGVTGSWSPAFRTITEVAVAAASGRMLTIESPHHFPHLVSDEFNEALATFMTEGDGPG